MSTFTSIPHPLKQKIKQYSNDERITILSIIKKTSSALQ